MRMILSPFLILGALGAVTAAPGDAYASANGGAQRYRGDQNAALEARMAGRILPLREIEKRVVPSMHGAQYLGFDFDSESGIYTLKFVRDGNMIWVDVDGRSGQVLRRSGD